MKPDEEGDHTVDRTPVESSNIVSVGYDPDSETLEVEFVGGGVYQYFDVPANEHAGLMGAPSTGKYFHANIKRNYRQVRLA